MAASLNGVRSMVHTAYPTVDLNFARYDITLAQPSEAAAGANALVSDTFADNMSTPVVVRTGAPQKEQK